MTDPRYVVEDDNPDDAITDDGLATPAPDLPTADDDTDDDTDADDPGEDPGDVQHEPVVEP